MNDLETRKEENLERINKARAILDMNLECNLISSENIITLLKKDKNYAFSRPKNNKDRLLKQIIVSPFVLCDQKRLSLEVKKLLPIMLETRCQDEVEELEKQNELGFIDDSELKEELEMLKFVYYLSSEDGREILRTGHVKNVKSKVLYKIKR